MAHNSSNQQKKGHPLEHDPGIDASPAALDGWVRLCAGVLATAGRDARAGDLGACRWLLSDDAALFAQYVGADLRTIRRQAKAWAAMPAAGKIVIRMTVAEAAYGT